MEKFRPVVYDAIKIGAACYLQAGALEFARREAGASAWWTYAGRTRSVQLEHRTLLKTQFDSQEKTLQYIEELRKLGYSRAPSSYAEGWTALHGRRVSNKTCQALMPESVLGNWEEKFNEGLETDHYEYDLNSAYASTMVSDFLPDVRSCRRVRGQVRRRPGIYLGVWRAGVKAPSWLERQMVPLWATTEEIQVFNLRCLKFDYGLIFDSWDDYRPCIDAIVANFRCWKEILRAFWGVWAAKSGCKAHTKNKPSGWQLPNPWRDTVLASYITSRVRCRVAEYVHKGAAAVFADQVLVPFKIKTSEEIGGWKLKKTVLAHSVPGRDCGSVRDAKQSTARVACQVNAGAASA